MDTYLRRSPVHCRSEGWRIHLHFTPQPICQPIASLQNLVRNPSVQGTRFLEYLESAAEVPVSDAKHNEIGRLRRADFGMSPCVVTLDPFTETRCSWALTESRGRHWEGPVWVLSIDDHERMPIFSITRWSSCTLSSSGCERRILNSLM
jgi:hypothetical protein